MFFKIVSQTCLFISIIINKLCWITNCSKKILFNKIYYKENFYPWNGWNRWFTWLRYLSIYPLLYLYVKYLSIYLSNYLSISLCLLPIAWVYLVATCPLFIKYFMQWQTQNKTNIESLKWRIWGILFSSLFFYSQQS